MRVLRFREPAGIALSAIAFAQNRCDLGQARGGNGMRYSGAPHRRKAAGIIVAPPWPNTGSANIFAAQAAAHAKFGHETLLVLGPLYASADSRKEIRAVETAMNYEGVSSVVHGIAAGTMRPYLSRSFLDWVLAGRDDTLAIRARYAARSRWRARILDFIDGHQIDVIHVNHAFEMLLGVRIRDLAFRRTNRAPPLICNTHDVQAKVYGNRGERNPFTRCKEEYQTLLETELRLYQDADILIHCAQGDETLFRQKLPRLRHRLVAPCLDPHHEKALTRLRAYRGAPQFDFLYVGNNNFANFVAIKWLLTEVFPRLQEPPPRVAIVGRINELVRRLERPLYEQFKHYFVGWVPDIEHYYAVSNVVLAPSLVGTGCSVKFIEALCAGKTVLITTDSLRGLSAQVQQRCTEFVSDGPRKFAEAMMTMQKQRVGDNNEPGSIYDDHFHSDHYIATMHDVFSEILA